MWYNFNRMIMQKSTITKADFSSKFLIWAGEKTNIISVFQAFFYHLSHWNDKLHFIFQLFKGVCNSFWFLIKFILNTVVRIRFQYSDEKVIYLCIFFLYTLTKRKTCTSGCHSNKWVSRDIKTSKYRLFALLFLQYVFDTLRRKMVSFHLHVFDLCCHYTY